MCQLETQALRPITQWKIPKKTLQQWFSKWGAGPLERDWSYCVGEFILITIFVRVLPWGCSLPWFPLFGINVILQLFTSRERCLGNVGEITRLYQWWWFSAGRDHILRTYPDLPGSHLWAVCVGCGRLKSWEEQGDANRLTLSRYSVVTNSVVTSLRRLLSVTSVMWWWAMTDVYAPLLCIGTWGSGGVVAGSVCELFVGYICGSTAGCYRSWHTMEAPIALSRQAPVITEGEVVATNGQRSDMFPETAAAGASHLYFQTELRSLRFFSFTLINQCVLFFWTNKSSLLERPC